MNIVLYNLPIYKHKIATLEIYHECRIKTRPEFSTAILLNKTMDWDQVWFHESSYSGIGKKDCFPLVDQWLQECYDNDLKHVACKFCKVLCLKKEDVAMLRNLHSLGGNAAVSKYMDEFKNGHIEYVKHFPFMPSKYPLDILNTKGKKHNLPGLHCK